MIRKIDAIQINCTKCSHESETIIKSSAGFFECCPKCGTQMIHKTIIPAYEIACECGETRVIIDSLEAERGTLFAQGHAFCSCGKIHYLQRNRKAA